MCHLWRLLFLPRHKKLGFIYFCFSQVKVISSWMATHFHVSLHFQGRKLFSGPPQTVKFRNKPFITCGFGMYFLKVCSNKVSILSVYIKNILKMSLKTLYKIYSGLIAQKNTQQTLGEAKFAVLWYNSSLLRREQHCSDFSLKGSRMFLFILWPTGGKKNK